MEESDQTFLFLLPRKGAIGPGFPEAFEVGGCDFSDVCEPSRSASAEELFLEDRGQFIESGLCKVLGTFANEESLHPAR